MPRTTNNITAPSFNDFGNTSNVFVETPSPSLEGTIAIQNLILSGTWSTFFGLSLGLSLLFAVGAVYAMMRVKQIRKIERDYYDAQPMSKISQKVFGTIDALGAEGARWRDVMTHVNSSNANDWRQAILEADVMLDDAISKRGYTGDGVGEKMKQVAKGDINTIDDAWDAHKMRNRIAHEGSDFELSQREARRVIGLYEKVFKELGYISD